MVSLTLHGLSVQETAGRREGSGILDRLSRADMEQFPVPADPPESRGYIDLAREDDFPNPSCSSVELPGKRGLTATSASW